MSLSCHVLTAHWCPLLHPLDLVYSLVPVSTFLLLLLLMSTNEHFSLEYCPAGYPIPFPITPIKGDYFLNAWSPPPAECAFAAAAQPSADRMSNELTSAAGVRVEEFWNFWEVCQDEIGLCSVLT